MADPSGVITLGTHPETDIPITLRSGPYGAYVQLEEPSKQPVPITSRSKKRTPKPKRASLPRGVNPSEFTLERAVELLSWPRDLGEADGINGETGGKVEVLLGRFGPYVQLGDVRAPLGKVRGFNACV